MSFKQPSLPYDLSALAPFVSEEQMDYHYNKHHASYFKKLNPLLSEAEQAMSLETLITTVQGPKFNNAAQAWNHTFFWDCMSPNGGRCPNGVLKNAIVRDFGSFDLFIEKFSESAAKLFGSGWAWLVTDHQGSLEILSLSNADNPLCQNKVPLLTLDVWEHAYYIDYRHERPRFIEQFKEVINWEFVQDRYLPFANQSII